jgi:hypothetical protein
VSLQAHGAGGYHAGVSADAVGLAVATKLRVKSAKPYETDFYEWAVAPLDQITGDWWP